MSPAYRQLSTGAQALRDKPRLGRIDMEALAQLPAGTLGHEYAHFMRRHGLDPSSLPLHPVEDDISFIEAHLRETHDIWHVVTGFGPDVASELGLQAFYLAQVPNRVAMAILSAGMLNTLIYGFDDSGARMTQIARGWTLGRQARPLFGTDWKQLWSTPSPRCAPGWGWSCGVGRGAAGAAPPGQRPRAGGPRVSAPGYSGVTLRLQAAGVTPWRRRNWRMKCVGSA